MMGKSKELSQDLRNLLFAKHTDGIGYRRISKLLNIPVSTVWTISRKWKEHHFTINWPRPGAPRKISDRGVKRIIRRVVQEPRTTCFLEAAYTGIQVQPLWFSWHCFSAIYRKFIETTQLCTCVFTYYTCKIPNLTEHVKNCCHKLYSVVSSRIEFNLLASL